MNKTISVGISDYKVSKSPDTLVTYALGSCVGIALYDATTNIGGLSHIMLPHSSLKSNKMIEDRMKYADTAIPDLISELEKTGAKRHSLIAKIFGGANMFGTNGTSFVDTIGERNIEAVKTILMENRIPLVAEDVGNNFGRTVYFQLENGMVKVQSLGKNIHEI
jgi:chemotaxis protein CheD